MKVSSYEKFKWQSILDLVEVDLSQARWSVKVISLQGLLAMPMVATRLYGCSLSVRPLQHQDTTTLPGCEDCVLVRGETTGHTPGSWEMGQGGPVLLAFLAAITLVLFGLLLSYFCRFLNTKNVNNFFH